MAALYGPLRKYLSTFHFSFPLRGAIVAKKQEIDNNTIVYFSFANLLFQNTQILFDGYITE
jgi:hypothetical protein